jgi:hypothetical protein
MSCLCLTTQRWDGCSTSSRWGGAQGGGGGGGLAPWLPGSLRRPPAHPRLQGSHSSAPCLDCWAPRRNPRAALTLLSAQSGLREAPLPGSPSSSSSGGSSGSGAPAGTGPGGGNVEEGGAEMADKLVMMPEEALTVQRGEAYISFYPGEAGLGVGLRAAARPSMLGAQGRGVRQPAARGVALPSRGHLTYDRPAARQRAAPSFSHPPPPPAPPRPAPPPTPGPFTKLTAGVDQQDAAPVIGQQWYSWRVGRDYHYRYELAPARGWLESVDRLFDLRGRGLAKAGGEGLFIIGHGARW